MTASSVQAPWVQMAVLSLFCVVSQQMLMYVCVCLACLMPSICTARLALSSPAMSAACELPASCPKVI